MKELVNIDYEHLFLTIAYNDVGMYPVSVTQNGVTKKRTEWQDGWNACHNAIVDKQIKYMKWYESLSEERQKYAAELLNSEYMLLYETNEGDVQPMLLMNDTFMYACSDAEECTPQDFSCIWDLWNQYKWLGLAAWAARHRNMEPLVELQTEQYKEAVNYLNKMWPA